MKRWMSLLLVLVLCMCLAACGSKGKSVEDIQKAGKLVVATSPDFRLLNTWMVTRLWVSKLRSCKWWQTNWA